MTEKKHKLEEEWVQDYPNSFGGKERSYKKYKNESSKKEIDDAFTKLDTYTKYKPFRKLRYYTPTYVYNARELFQIDTVYMNTPVLLEANDNIGFIICIIDCFTKRAFCYPNMKNDCNTAVNCMKNLFSKLDKLPVNVVSDKVNN